MSSETQVGEVKLFIGNLPFDISERELFETFSAFGQLRSVCLLGNGKSKSGNSCAFVIFVNGDCAHQAMRALDGSRSIRATADLAPMQVRLARSNQFDKAPSAPLTFLPTRKRSFTDSVDASPTSTMDSTPKGERLLSSMALGSQGASDSFVKFFVGSLPAETTKVELEALFSNLHLPLRAEDGVHLMPGRGASGQACAFVHVAASVASEVAEKINGKIILGGCQVNVRLANSQEKGSKKSKPITAASTAFLGFPAVPVSNSLFGPAFPMAGGYNLYGGYGDSSVTSKFANLFYNPGYSSGSSYGKVIPENSSILGGYKPYMESCNDDKYNSPKKPCRF